MTGKQHRCSVNRHWPCFGLVVVFGSLSLASTAVEAQDGYYRESGVQCDQAKYTDCKDDVRAKADGAFNFAFANDDTGYTVSTVWIRARKAGPRTGKTGAWTGIGKRGSNIESSPGGTALFSFDDAYIADQLGWSATALKANGFDIRLKYEQEGSGTGKKRDDCKIANVRYSDADLAWVWRKKGGDTWRIVPSSQGVFWFQAAGSYLNAKCDLRSIDGKTTSEPG